MCKLVIDFVPSFKVQPLGNSAIEVVESNAPLSLLGPVTADTMIVKELLGVCRQGKLLGKQRGRTCKPKRKEVGKKVKGPNEGDGLTLNA